jgi:hypothetical protein
MSYMGAQNKSKMNAMIGIFETIGSLYVCRVDIIVAFFAGYEAQRDLVWAPILWPSRMFWALSSRIILSGAFSASRPQ